MRRSPLVGQHLDDDGGGAVHDSESDNNRLPEAEPEDESGPETHQRDQRHLRQRDLDDRNQNVSDLVDAHLDPQQEQEERQPEFGHRLGQHARFDDPENGRPQEQSRHDVGDDRRLAGTGCDESHRGRGDDYDTEIYRQGGLSYRFYHLSITYSAGILTLEAAIVEYGRL